MKYNHTELWPSDLACNEHIFLRGIQLSDASDIFSIIERNRNHFSIYMNWVKNIQSEQDITQFIQNAFEKYQQDQECSYAILFEEKLVGLITLRNKLPRLALKAHNVDSSSKNDEPHEFSEKSIMEVGYWLDSQYSRKGIMTTSLHRISQTMLNHYGIEEVHIKCATFNEPSNQVPMRAGFFHQTVLHETEEINGVLHDQNLYSLKALKTT